MDETIQKIVETENTDEKKTVYDLGRFFRYTTITFLGISLISTALFIVMIVNYRDELIKFFSIFEYKSIQNYAQLIIAEPGFGRFTEIVIIITTILLFFYLLASISQKGILIYESNEVEAKYFHALNLLLAFFNYIILIPYLLYLTIIVTRFTEAFIIFLFWIISAFIFVPLFKNFGKIMFNYSSLLALRPITIEKEFKIQISNSKILLTSGFNYFIDKKIKKIKMNNDEEKKLRNDFDYFIFIGKNWLILLVKKQRNLLFKAIMSLMLMSLFFGYILQFNLLSIIYFELNYFLWYFIISSFSNIPNGCVTIFLNDDTIFNDIFIIEDSEKGHILILNEFNVIRSISKSSIKFMESKTQTSE